MVSGDKLTAAANADRENQATPEAHVTNSFWHKLFGPDLSRLTMEHLALVFFSLAASIILGVPLGILAARHHAAEAIILGITGVLQTIPSLALLAILIPITGKIGLSRPSLRSPSTRCCPSCAIPTQV